MKWLRTPGEVVENSGENSRHLRNNDGTETLPQHDGVREVELTLEQHYGLRIFDTGAGRTMVSFREGGGWSRAAPIQDVVRLVQRSLASSPGPAKLR